MPNREENLCAGITPGLIFTGFPLYIDAHFEERKSMKEKKHVLIVDDEESLRFVLAEELARSEYEVETAADGLLAMDKLRERHFDLVILDIRMPNMDGLEVLRNIRKENLAEKVVMLTGVAEMRFAQDSLTLGANDFLSKPLDLQALHSCIKRNLA
jgi:DNA-binding NtrC family response regulator